MDLREQIAKNPMRGYQWLVVALAVLLNLLDGFDVLAIAFTAKSIQGELGLNGENIGTLMSAGFIGMALGSLFLAPVADKFGRRPILLTSVFLAALGMLMVNFSSSMMSIGFWRVVTGIGVGGILPCTNVLVSEYSNNKWRGLAIAIYASGFGIGAILGGLSAIELQNEYGWRIVFVVGALLTFGAWIILWFLLPESVDFLMTKHPKNAQQRLQQLAQKIGFAGDWQLLEKDTGKKKVPVMNLFEPQNRATTLWIWLAFFATMASFFFISAWTPSLLETSGMSKEKSQVVGMAISAGGTLGALFFGFLVSRWATFRVLLIFTLLSSVAVIAFIYNSNLQLALVLAVLIGMLINGCITGLYTINPTLYASDYRSTGAGMAIGIGRIGSILSPIIAGRLLDQGWQKNELYLSASVVMLVVSIAVIALRKKI